MGVVWCTLTAVYADVGRGGSYKPPPAADSELAVMLISPRCLTRRSNAMRRLLMVQRTQKTCGSNSFLFVNTPSLSVKNTVTFCWLSVNPGVAGCHKLLFDWRTFNHSCSLYSIYLHLNNRSISFAVNFKPISRGIWAPTAREGWVITAERELDSTVGSDYHEICLCWTLMWW